MNAIVARVWWLAGVAGGVMFKYMPLPHQGMCVWLLKSRVRYQALLEHISQNKTVGKSKILYSD